MATLRLARAARHGTRLRLTLQDRVHLRYKICALCARPCDPMHEEAEKDMNR